MMRGTLVLLALCLILPLALGAANDLVLYVFPVTTECDPALRVDGDIVLYLRQARNSIRLALNAEEITVPKLADRLRIFTGSGMGRGTTRTRGPLFPRSCRPSKRIFGTSTLFSWTPIPNSQSERLPQYCESCVTPSLPRAWS
jgi:hypothetical protein